ncbi:hypothetical protein [Chitinophaga ginsengisoli]|uniref:Uncharacterized protein n=1 Tax=Chitinophaga ginsengisoli TaxID=363837 RepID=A0A2P8FTN3_9BACT|nr:hypothetical protein [Chitinophaga ginsengisoli]PSL24995.1 hypothetical protein CLV42_114144 [Chitinophaga ginsengisoli]
MKIYLYIALAIVLLSQAAVFFIDFTMVQALLVAGLITCCSVINIILTYKTDFTKRFRFPKKTIRFSDKNVELTNLRVASMGLILALFGIYCVCVLKAKVIGLVFIAAGLNYISFFRMEIRKPITSATRAVNS